MISWGVAKRAMRCTVTDCPAAGQSVAQSGRGGSSPPERAYRVILRTENGGGRARRVLRSGARLALMIRVRLYCALRR
jgi:hypothetical protein